MTDKKISISVAIIGLISAVVWWLISSWTINLFSKNNEIETRMFDIKKTVYSDFLDEYYKNFNNSVMKKKYEETYEKMVAYNLYGACWLAGHSRHVWDNIDLVKKDLEYNIRECYYNSPYECWISTCFWIKPENVMISWFNNTDIAKNIWLSQSDSMNIVLDEMLSNFIKNTYKFQLILPEDIYNRAIEWIKNKLYTCENCYRDCGEWNTSDCWFDFDKFNIKDSIKEVFINPWVIDELKEDLQKHYK